MATYLIAGTAKFWDGTAFTKDGDGHMDFMFASHDLFDSRVRPGDFIHYVTPSSDRPVHLISANPLAPFRNTDSNELPEGTGGVCIPTGFNPGIN